MSVKRQASTDLNHENWDQEDPPSQEEMGTFQKASDDVLEKRVIRTAKRRAPISGDEAKKSVFSGFGGFNKTKPPSFDFLANLTNGTKAANGSDNTESGQSSNLFGNKPVGSGGLFSIPMSSSPSTKTTFGMPTSQMTPFGPGTSPTSTPFGAGTSTTSTPFGAGTSPTSTPFGAGTSTTSTPFSAGTSTTTMPFGTGTSTTVTPFGTGTSTTVTPFGTGTSTTSTPFGIRTRTTTIPFGSGTSTTSTSFGIRSSTISTPFGTTTSATSVPFGTGTITTSKQFGTGTSTTSTPFGSGTSTTSTPFGTAADTQFKIPTSSGSKGISKSTDPNSQTSSVFATNASPKSIFGLNTASSTPSKMSNTTPNTNDDEKEKKEEKRMNYYTKLRGLNESVSDWIKQHVEETPLCILSPIFKDYQKYLEEIQEEYHGTQEETVKNSNENKPAETKPSQPTNILQSTTETLGTSGALFTATNSKLNSTVFGNLNTTATTTEKPSADFSFGIKTTSSTVTTASGGFSFGVNTGPSTTTASAPFSFATNTTTTGANGAAPFSFGIGKPFSFSSNIQTKSEEKTDENKEEDDEPPKAAFIPFIEENSVFEKKCKVFFKKDGTFVDKGVGTLYVKKIEESGKHQLLIRANTNLGTILLNMILSSSTPMQRLGKNNVMLVCVPTPDHKPPPTPVLIRVKNSEEADEILETLNKYKA